jgi:hypothetical protein
MSNSENQTEVTNSTDVKIAAAESANSLDTVQETPNRGPLMEERPHYSVVFFVRYGFNKRPSVEDIIGFFNKYGTVHHVNSPQDRHFAFVFMDSLNTPVEHRKTRTTITNIINDMTPETRFHITVASSNRNPRSQYGQNNRRPYSRNWGNRGQYSSSNYYQNNYSDSRGYSSNYNRNGASPDNYSRGQVYNNYGKTNAWSANTNGNRGPYNNYGDNHGNYSGGRRNTTDNSSGFSSKGRVDNDSNNTGADYVYPPPGFNNSESGHTKDHYNNASKAFLGNSGYKKYDNRQNTSDKGNYNRQQNKPYSKTGTYETQYVPYTPNSGYKTTRSN